MSESGALKVNQHLQVEGFANIFAIGDCNNVNEAKTAYNADRHASVAVGNIANSVSGKQLTAYQTGTHAPQCSHCNYTVQVSFPSDQRSK